MKCTLTSVLFILTVIACLAQPQGAIPEKKIEGLYISSLADFFDKLEKETGVDFSFDREQFAAIAIHERYVGTFLSTIVKQVCKEYKLKYLVDASGVIYFYDPARKSAAETMPAYAGAPTKFNISVSGTVKDSQSSETLPFVNVLVKGTRLGTTTNIDGRFTLLNVPTDTSTLVFSYIGYTALPIRLNPNTNPGKLTIDMVEAVTNLDEVMVSSTRDELVQVNEKVSMVKLTPARLNMLPNLGEKDIFRSLQLMPGISAANENSSGLYVRGGTPDQALVTYDGFTVYHVDHLFGFFSAFNTNAIKDVNLYKGGFESKFGGRISSVAEITGKDGNQNNFNIGGDLSFLSANLFAEIPIGKKTSVLVAGRRSWKGPLYNKIFDAFGPEETQPPTQFANRPGFASAASTVSSYFYDVNGKITFRPSQKDVLALSFYNGADDLDNSTEIPSFAANFGNFSASTADVTGWGNTGSSLKWSRQWNSKLYSNTLVSYSNYYSNRDRSNTRTITPTTGDPRTIKTGIIEDNNIYDYSFKSDIQYQLNPSHTLEFGTHLTKNIIDYSYSQNDTVSIINRNDNGNTLAFYAQDRIKLFDNKLLLVPGVRFTHFDVTGKSYVEPRLSVNYAANDRLTLKGAYGIYNQFAKRVIREDVLQGSRDFWVLANGDNLPVSNAQHYIAGASYETNGFVFDVEGYYKKLKGLTEYSLRFTTDLGGISYEDSFFQGTGSTKGVDVTIQKKAGKYSGWIGYTLSETLHNFPIYQAKDFHAANDVTNEFKLVNMYKAGRWDFSLTWIYATGRPYTEPSGGYSVTLLDGTQQDFVSVTSKNGVRLPDYHRLDAAVTYNWKGRWGTQNSLSATFFNLYDRKNVWYKEFQIETDQLVQTDIKFLGFTPNLTLSVKLR